MSCARERPVLFSPRKHVTDCITVFLLAYVPHCGSVGEALTHALSPRLPPAAHMAAVAIPATRVRSSNEECAETAGCVTCRYHFGARYIVEMEVVMPGDMTVAESHDIALALQHKVEALDDVER